jgi:hypothetical protein
LPLLGINLKKLTLLIILISLVSCASPTPSPTIITTSAISNCDPKDMEKYSASLMPFYTKWAEAMKKAYATQPENLSAEISTLQEFDGGFKSIFPPACLTELHKALLSASDYMIKGFSALSSGEAEAKVADYFARANTMLAFTINELKIITVKTQ